LAQEATVNRRNQALFGHQRCFMEIIMRLVILPAAAALFIANFAHAKENSPPTEPEQLSGPAVIGELNLARENPKLYATFAAESRSFHMSVRGRAVYESMRFLAK